MHKKLIFVLSIISFSATAQIGGRSSFDFMNVPPSSRLSALGGVNVSLTDRDVAFFSSNPSLAGDTLSGFASASYQFYVADIGQASFVYSHSFKKIGAVIFGLQHIGYGSIQGYDLNGLETNTFNAGETALLIGKNHQAGNFRLGVTAKGIFSNIAGYRASAIAFDLGGVFIHPEKPFTVGLAIKNLGFTFNKYSTSNNTLPFDVQLGTTFKPEHMPMRFSITAYNLYKSDITYSNSTNGDQRPGTIDKIASHLNLGVEFLLHKNVTIMAGYNHLIHQALKLPNGGGGAGISLGFSAQVKSFEFAFSRGALVAGNAGYSFTLSTNIRKLLKRQ